MSKSTDVSLRTVVAGGSGAIGDAVLSALLKRGDRVINLDRTSGERTPWIEMDLAQQGSVDAAVEEAAQRLGGIDVLIQTAGIFRAAEFMALSDGDFAELLNINLLGSFRVAQSVARHMLDRGGRILFISSIHAQHGVKGRLAYAASKAGIEAMTRVMAVELSHRMIRVNALAPGAVSSGMTASEALVSQWDRVTPAGRKVTSDEVASMALLLTDTGASFVSGQVIAQDGGASTAQVF